MKVKPNFFIVGAPKCGTTALSSWLSAHPQIFMPKQKEIDFFDSDRKKGYRNTIEQYERFFAGAQTTHFAVGEASTGYLRSRVAIPKILEYSPRSRFIVGLRNPIDMAISWHQQAINESWETEYDFARAWFLQDRRWRGQNVPLLCPDGNNLVYGEVCRLGTQVTRLLSAVPRERVFLYTMDEMKNDPRKLWKSLLDFLGLQDDGRTEFSVLNTRSRRPWVIRVATRVVADSKRNLGISNHGFGILNALNRGLAREGTATIPAFLRQEMANYFRGEIALLERHLNRDLSHWR